MIKAVFTYQNDIIKSFVLKGHAGFAEHGKDIVCSAVTTAVFTSLSLIDSLLDPLDYELIQDEASGLIDFKIKITDDFINLIIENLYQVLLGIEARYPSNVKVKKENSQ